MRIHRIVPRTRAEGPGWRFALWVQGCHNGCPGCFAREMWDPRGGKETALSELLRSLRETKERYPELSGVTLLGGEPMEQAEELALFAEEAGKLGLTVLTFTGLTREGIASEGTAAQRRLLDASDLLIDGPYREEERDFSRPLAGSRNQVFHFLTGRIRPEEMKEAGNRVELRISPQGLLSGNGMGGLLAEAKLRQLYGAPAAGGSGEDGQEGPEGTEHERSAEDGAHGI